MDFYLSNDMVYVVGGICCSFYILGLVICLEGFFICYIFVNLEKFFLFGGFVEKFCLFGENYFFYLYYY